MKTKCEVLVLIPARSGSKRVKNKNIRPLNGKPLIAYTISAALKSKNVTRVIVTTDSKEIAEVAKKAGAEVPFLRPKSISSSTSTETEFHKHALEWLEKNERYKPDLIVNLYPTSPFRKTATIDAAIKKILRHPKADSLRSIRLCSEHPYKMWVQSTGEEVTSFIKPKKAGGQTLSYQLLPKVYIQNASIYITKPKTISKYGSTVGKKVIGFEMSEIESVDINTPLDFSYAEYLIKK